MKTEEEDKKTEEKEEVVEERVSNTKHKPIKLPKAKNQD